MASHSAQSLDVLKQQRLVEGAVATEAIQERERTVILALLIQDTCKPHARRLDHCPPQPGKLFGEQSFQEGVPDFRMRWLRARLRIPAQIPSLRGLRSQRLL